MGKTKDDKTMFEKYSDKRRYIIDKIGIDSYKFMQEGFEYAEKYNDWVDVVDDLYELIYKGLNE